MQLGMIGLGRMGANIVRRLMRDGHECVVFDNSPESIKALEAEGATGALTLEEFAAKLTVPRAAWVMIPASVTGQVVEQVAEVFQSGDIIIDGGNSNYREDIDRAAALKPTRCSPRSRPGSMLHRARRDAPASRAVTSRAICTAGRTVPGTSSRWSTTASSTD